MQLSLGVNNENFVKRDSHIKVADRIGVSVAEACEERISRWKEVSNVTQGANLEKVGFLYDDLPGARSD